MGMYVCITLEFVTRFIHIGEDTHIRESRYTIGELEPTKKIRCMSESSLWTIGVGDVGFEWKMTACKLVRGYSMHELTTVIGR